MTADVELLPCGECGMPCRPGEYHPYAACLMFKTCRNSDTVRGNLQDAQDHATAEKDAEVEALRVEVGDYRTNGAAAVRFAPNSAYWSNELRRLFGDDARTGIEVLENQYRQELARAERLAEALREAADMLLADYPETAKRLRAALNPTAAQENDDNTQSGETP